MAVQLLALLPIPSKLSKSSKADQGQRKINGDTLQDVFELIFGHLQDVAHTWNMCTCSGNGTQEWAVPDLLCLVDLYLVYLI